MKKRPQDQTNEEWWADWDKRDREIKLEESGDEMNINEVYAGGSFLKAEDLQGSTVKLTIEGVGTHTFNEGKPDQKTQIVLSFAGKEKKLGLNKTNAQTIAAQLGDETNAWNGKVIKLYPTTTDFGGTEVACIRVVQEMPPEADGLEGIPF